MTRERKDKGAVPQARRKPRPTAAAMPRGGTAFAVEKQTAQMDLFAITAEAKSKTTKAKGSETRSKCASKPKVPKVANTAISNGLAEMERVCARLPAALERVFANHGAPGPNRQTVTNVKDNWEQIKPKLVFLLLNGEYQPGDIRRVWIPKSGGGERGLGIPNVIDRVVQEAVRQVIEPHFEPMFHPSSHGFRPKRSCHSAIAEASRHLKEGFNFVVDIDLKDFFNRVHHQRLLCVLQRKLKDARFLKLISQMLKAKVVMPDGVRIETEMGVPQGGPLSPLLSNIVLDELDKEISRRGLRFVRYADDCNIYVRSARAGERVMASLKRFIERRLRLEVNTAKSAVARPKERHFLGFTLNRQDSGEVEINLSERSKRRIREKVVELTPRNWGDTISRAIKKTNEYLKGWTGFFGICTGEVEYFLNGTDAHMRRRLRAMQLKQWKTKLTMKRRLVKLGAKRTSAAKVIYDGHKGIWKLSHTPVVNKTLNNAYWRKQGLLSLAELWKQSNIRKTVFAPEQIELCLG